METKNYTLSKETATYLDAVRALEEACNLVLSTAEEVYGNLNAPTGDEVTSDFMEAYNKTVDEVFKLIQANTCQNLGLRDNVRQSTVTI